MFSGGIERDQWCVMGWTADKIYLQMEGTCNSYIGLLNAKNLTLYLVIGRGKLIDNGNNW